MPEPYYQDGSVTIYHGDCREILPSLSCDAIITDPPYGIGAYRWDTVVSSPALLRDLAAMAPCAVFGWPERLVALCVAAGLSPDEWITWAPTNGACRGFNPHGLWRITEHIAVFGSGDWRSLLRPRSSNAKRIVSASYKATSTSASLHIGAAPSRGDMAREGDVWTDPAPGLAFQSKQRKHPNEKPLGVMRRLVTALCPSGGTVLDPFVGSGTTLLAARELGRKAIGIEIEERYCEIAVERLAQEVLDLQVALHA